MSEQNWARKEYETWDEAFRALAPICRQQSVRVAEYTRVLFVAACASSFGRGTPEGAARMKGKYAEAAYKCGFYHQLGKALVPPEYQIWQKDFSEEEKAVYRKYTTDGRALIASLQERTSREKEKRSGALLELDTKNIPWLMMRESCEQHMERFDGSGYPEGRSGADISPIAQIVGLAKELDRLSAETVSEHPFDEAWETLTGQSGTAWAPELIAVLKKARPACEAIYQKYIQYTMTVPETIPLVRKREGRPLGLEFRPLVGDNELHVVAYEAIPWFGGILGRDSERDGLETVAGMIERADLVEDVCTYLLYEAGDLAHRLKNCRISGRRILLHLLPAYFEDEQRSRQITQIAEDQEVGADALMLIADEKTINEASPAFADTLKALHRAGVAVAVDNFHPDAIPVERLQELGLEWLRLDPELYKQPGSANTFKLLRQAGFRLLGKDAGDEDTLSWLLLCGVEMVGGPMAGVAMSEDEVIRDELARLR
ncbi:MAG: EAL domain-containing protein [Oscillospiraceae bacterium]|nr:EAL domain-containing protein [Oscillospiraceae bacterium]